MQDAVERNIITIGEAMGALLRLDHALPISDCSKIADARNKLIHGYDEIDNVIVWTIIVKHLPTLKVEVKTLLEK